MEVAFRDVLSGKGVADGDLLLMTRKSPQVRQTAFGQQSMEAMMQSVLNDKGLMATMEANNPKLAAAIRYGHQLISTHICKSIFDLDPLWPQSCCP